jgi:hypothetical protein
MVGQARYELLRRNPKGFTDSEQREHRGRTASLDHLPVTDAKAVGDHILLA